MLLHTMAAGHNMSMAPEEIYAAIKSLEYATCGPPISQVHGSQLWCVDTILTSINIYTYKYVCFLIDSLKQHSLRERNFCAVCYFFLTISVIFHFYKDIIHNDTLLYYLYV